MQRNCGCNTITDNFLISVQVAALVEGKEITEVKTVRINSKGLPKEITGSSKERFSSKFFHKASKNCLLVNYRGKLKKKENLISTMHEAPNTDGTEKRKTLVINFYNKNKVGDNVFNQMTCKYTAHTSSRRWPLAVWTSILDIVALNSWIVYKKVSS